jgi:flagellar M-ring protein FliF
VPTAKKGSPNTNARETGQSSKTDNNTYGVNKTTRHTIEPAGSIRRLTAAVVLDDAVMRQQQNGKWVETHQRRKPEELRMISELAQAAIGFNSDRGDVISVQNLAFDRPAPDDQEPATLMDRARKGMSDLSSAIRYGALLALFLLVYLLMIRPIQKRVLATPAHELATVNSLQQANPADFPIADPKATLAERSMVIKKQLAEFVKAEPESSTTAVRAWLREEAE